jgi:hypothetical protein
MLIFSEKMTSNEDIHSILVRIADVVAESGRKIADNDDAARARNDLRTCQLNLDRISQHLARDVYEPIAESIEQLLQLAVSEDVPALNGSVAHFSANVQDRGTL